MAEDKGREEEVATNQDAERKRNTENKEAEEKEIAAEELNETEETIVLSDEEAEQIIGAYFPGKWCCYRGGSCGHSSERPESKITFK